MHLQKEPFAEVLESSLIHWVAQSWQWDSFPQFGSLVTIHTPERIIFGIVYDIKTGSIDPSRYPFAYKKTEEELRAEQPQIFEFLQTTFSCIIVGYLYKQTIVHQLAPIPPKIHAFISYPCPELYKNFFCEQTYLHILFALGTTISNLDELLLALLKQLVEHAMLQQNTLDHFITTFSLLTGNDYRRLKIFLQRAQTFI